MSDIQDRGTYSETYEMLQKAFDNESKGRIQTYEWWKRIDSGNSIEDSPPSGQQSTSPDE